MRSWMPRITIRIGGGYNRSPLTGWLPPQKQVRAGALYALKILCCVRKLIEPHVVIQPVLEMLRDPDVGGIAEDLIEDIYRESPPH